MTFFALMLLCQVQTPFDKCCKHTPITLTYLSVKGESQLSWFVAMPILVVISRTNQFPQGKHLNSPLIWKLLKYQVTVFPPRTISLLLHKVLMFRDYPDHHQSVELNLIHSIFFLKQMRFFL